MISAAGDEQGKRVGPPGGQALRAASYRVHRQDHLDAGVPAAVAWMHVMDQYGTVIAMGGRAGAASRAGGTPLQSQPQAKPGPAKASWLQPWTGWSAPRLLL